MSRLLLTVSAVIRTPGRTGLPPPAPPLPPSRDPRLPPFAPPCCADPPPVLPPEERDPKPLPKPLDDEPLLLLPLLLLPFRDRRSALDVDAEPDPGAIWLLAESSEAEEDPPMNISVSTRAI